MDWYKCKDVDIPKPLLEIYMNVIDLQKDVSLKFYKNAFTEEF